ncbi:hypothetical protein M436DRAFT_86662 [Aureobasidium namibiae CBS 147.97]|uniref:Ecp2 effector protein domain-containing protein n=1 Tax=Aureobasidium namibiae CBS 147.97 TaxID=1043004 RepID=A0A074W4V7_9PEZI|nr:uncharacterized protein M436DRAFT_86662 [Aureobasidium namibiae CBS 147.97]KEQ68135.1 hypothetical protein M436DRAFT_86662 [Aureobasidium namibiae CBS 147.97]
MHLSLPLIIATVSLCTAAPVTITDSTLIEKRADLIEVTPFYSGEWMNLDEIERGVNQWCANQNGQVVPWGKSTNAQISGLTLHSGGPGILAAHYTNDDVRSGWTINEGECNDWMMQIASLSPRGRSDGTHTQGGHGKIGGYGSIWIDPNAA